MSKMDVVNELESALSNLPILDPHTHLTALRISARGLDDILLYHMSISDLYAAGCPSGSRIDENRSTEEAHRRIRQAIPFLSKTRNTFIAWGIRIILRDLYGWTEEITSDNWQRLDALIAERSKDPVWPREILRRAGIVRSGTELARRGNGEGDDVLQYSLEWAFFMRTQWGQPDIPLYELEHAWNDEAPAPPLPVSLDRKKAPPLVKTIKTVDDVKKALRHYCELIPYGNVLATAQHISTDMQYSNPDDATMAEALKHRAQATHQERDIYASYIMHHFLAELEKRADQIVFQFSLGAEALPYESASRLNQQTIGQLAEIIAAYPKLRFMCFLSSRHSNQSLCTLARELPNFSLAGYWWHSFFPGAIRQVMEERLDMLPLNKQIGFFSDAYVAEWSYAKAVMVRNLLAEVLAEKVKMGQYAMDEATSIAREILFDSPAKLLGMAKSSR